MIYTRNQAPAVLDIVNKAEVRQIYDCALNGAEFVTGEWALVQQANVADGGLITASKITVIPTDIGGDYRPCFAATALNSSATAVNHGAFVDGPHAAWTHLYTGTAPTKGAELMIDATGALAVATSGKVVVAHALSGVTARDFWSQGCVPQDAIKYKTVDPYLKA